MTYKPAYTPLQAADKQAWRPSIHPLHRNVSGRSNIHHLLSVIIHLYLHKPKAHGKKQTDNAAGSPVTKNTSIHFLFFQSGKKVRKRQRLWVNRPVPVFTDAKKTCHGKTGMKYKKWYMSGNRSTESSKQKKSALRPVHSTFPGCWQAGLSRSAAEGHILLLHRNYGRSVTADKPWSKRRPHLLRLPEDGHLLYYSGSSSRTQRTSRNHQQHRKKAVQNQRRWHKAVPKPA